MLLELEFKTNKQVHGVYAVDVLSGGMPRLLIPNGERPVWSPRRNYIGYIMDDALRFVRRNNQNDVWFDPYLSYDRDVAIAPPIVWFPHESGFAYVEHLGLEETRLWICPPHSPEPLWTEEAVGGVGPIPDGGPPQPEEGDPESELFRPCFNSPSFSPDSDMACEIYPRRPFMRGKSRIYIVQTGVKGVWVNLLPKRRLTDLGPGTFELQPLWSPNGQWIAFLVGEQKSTNLKTFVTTPKGRPLTCLMFHWTGSSLETWGELASNEAEADYYDFSPVEWSPDGHRLLLTRGPLRFLFVVQRSGDSWVAKEIGQADRQAVFGPNHQWVAAIRGAERPVFSRDVVTVYNIDDPEETTTVKLPPGCRVLWMDW